MKIFLNLVIVVKCNRFTIRIRKNLIVRLAMFMTKDLIRENYGFAYKS